MNASAIMHKAAINNNNEYAGNSGIEGVGVGVGVGVVGVTLA